MISVECLLIYCVRSLCSAPPCRVLTRPGCMRSSDPHRNPHACMLDICAQTLEICIGLAYLRTLNRRMSFLPSSTTVLFPTPTCPPTCITQPTPYQPTPEHIQRAQSTTPPPPPRRTRPARTRPCVGSSCPTARWGTRRIRILGRLRMIGGFHFLPHFATLDPHSVLVLSSTPASRHPTASSFLLRYLCSFFSAPSFQRRSTN